MIKKEQLLKRYPIGTRIELGLMNDAQAVPSGTLGTVSYIDDIGTIHMNWDNGSTLGIVYGEDKFKVVKEVYTQIEDYEIIKMDGVKIKANLVQHDSMNHVQDCTINNLIMMDNSDYIKFSNNLNENQDFISKMNQDIKNNTDSPQCFIVTNLACRNGILVQIQDDSLSIKTAFLDNIDEFLVQHTISNDDIIYQESEIRVVIVEPNMRPYEAIIPNEYELISKLVGGNIEEVRIGTSASIICNEEGKLLNLKANRQVGNDIIAGRFIVVGTGESEYFQSLSSKDVIDNLTRFTVIHDITQEEMLDKMNISFSEFGG